jgi:hypothetical protein
VFIDAPVALWSGADLGFFRTALEEIHHPVPHIVRHYILVRAVQDIF